MAIDCWIRRAAPGVTGTVAAMAGHAAFAAFSQIIVFGDSSVDAGYYRALASPGSTTAYNAD